MPENETVLRFPGAFTFLGSIEQGQSPKEASINADLVREAVVPHVEDLKWAAQQLYLARFRQAFLASI